MITSRVDSCKYFPSFCKFSSSFPAPKCSSIRPSRPSLFSPTPLSKPQNSLLLFLRSHLKPYFTTTDLLRALKKMHFNPHLAHFDLQVFYWATNKEGFRHDHNTYEWIIRSLASRDQFPEMQKVLDDMAASPCPCSEGDYIETA